MVALEAFKKVLYDCREELPREAVTHFPDLPERLLELWPVANRTSPLPSRRAGPPRPASEQPDGRFSVQTRCLAELVQDAPLLFLPGRQVPLPQRGRIFVNR